MKKFALALMAAAAMVLGMGVVANAYPPGAGSVTATPPTGAPGYTVTVSATCLPGETATFTLVSESASATCGAAGTAASLLGLSAAGRATVTLNTPNAPGVYTGSATGSSTGNLGNFTVTVTAPPAGLPATGSDGVGIMTIVALGLFAVGAGLFGVAQFRRRSVTA